MYTRRDIRFYIYRGTWTSALLGSMLALIALAACAHDDRPPPPPPDQCVDPEPAITVPVADALATLDGLPFDEFVEQSHVHLLLRMPELITELDIAGELEMKLTV